MIAHICSITGIVNPSHFYSPVVSTSVVQLTKICRSFGCRPVGLSPTLLSPCRRFVAHVHSDENDETIPSTMQHDIC